MERIKDQIQELFDTCERIYEEGGASAVVEYIEEAIRQGDNVLLLDVEYEHCHACDNDYPSLNHVCLVCGQPTAITKQNLVDAVIRDLKKGFEAGDYTVLDELLFMLPNKNLIQSLPEDHWKKYDNLKSDNIEIVHHQGHFCPEPIYFKVMKSGWNGDSQRQEVEINCGDNGKLMIVKTDEGFVIDVYGQNDHVLREYINENEME